MTIDAPTEEYIPSTLSFEITPYLSDRDKTYVTDEEKLHSFIKYPVKLNGFDKVFRDKKHDNTDRQLLASVLRKQYDQIDRLDVNRESLIESLLDKDTFTITTAHQPCLFTGPLYVIYKIISTINASRDLNERYEDKNIQPVFIVGGEDHDFEEINHTYIFGNKVEWESEKSGGPVGRMSTQDMNDALEQLKEICGSDDRASKWYDLMEQAYTDYDNYGKATRVIFHELFKDTPLLILSMDDEELKGSFTPYISKEILKQYSAPYVREAQENLKEEGFDSQAYVRDINFFYITQDGRDRIEKENNDFKVVDTDISFSTSEMAEEINNYPERFSPNVVMRPIYQEHILPNLAYIGGGGELAYWMERKMQFEAFDINFPMLIRRDSVILVDNRLRKDLKKLDLKFEDLLTDIENLVKSYAVEYGDGETSLSQFKKEVHNIFEEIEEQAYEIDKSLKKYVKAEESGVQKTLQQIEDKLVKAEKDRLDIELNKIRRLKDRVFPENGLQERRDNFLSWVIRYDDDFWNALYKRLDVFSKEIKVITFD